MSSERPILLKANSSSLTQTDFAEAGEAITIRDSESSSALDILLLKSCELASSSRSLNIGASLPGKRPLSCGFTDEV